VERSKGRHIILSKDVKHKIKGVLWVGGVPAASNGTLLEKEHKSAKTIRSRVGKIERFGLKGKGGAY